MRREDVEHLFNTAVTLDEGAAIRIPFDSKNAMHCGRVQMYRERDRYMLSMKGAAVVDVGISVSEGNGLFYLILKRESRPLPVEIIYPDGRLTLMERCTEAPAAQCLELNEHGLTADQQRMYKCMIEDGHSHEEALSFLVA